MEAYIVDSFTNTPFKGNPAGVCLYSGNLSEEKMLSIADELNFSETAFVRGLSNPNEFSIRYFSPKMEIPLCGHATLASAKVLYSRGAADDLLFITHEGVHLPVKKIADRIGMLFPVYDLQPGQANAEFLSALGLREIEHCLYSPETNSLFLEIGDPNILKNLSPDFDALLKSRNDINGVSISSPSDHPDYDFFSRYFWPWGGTNEDPVTGGTHTFLTKYWANKLGKNTLRSYQCSKRGGSMELELREDKVLIKAEAVILFEGKFNL